MLNIALTSEFSFRHTFAHMKELVATTGEFIGVADWHNTFSHFRLMEECKRNGKSPLFGVRVMAVRDPEANVAPRGQWGPTYIVLAKNQDGLIEINRLVQRATECFYYRAHVGLVDIWRLSDNVVVISEDFSIDERVDYIGVSFLTPQKNLARNDIPRVALQASRYIVAEDKEAYEAFLGREADSFVFPGHLLSEAEWLHHHQDRDAVANTYVVAEMCRGVELRTAPPVKYDGELTLEGLCLEGAARLGVDLSDPVYKARYEREMNMIDLKGYRDYFLIVASLVNHAKETMLVGPGRGSAGGSLVCYLSGITTLDPIKWDLLFERFLDINRGGWRFNEEFEKWLTSL